MKTLAQIQSMLTEANHTGQNLYAFGNEKLFAFRVISAKKSRAGDIFLMDIKLRSKLYQGQYEFDIR